MSVWKNELPCIVHPWMFPQNCAYDSQKLREVTTVRLSSLLLYRPKSFHKPSIPHSQFHLPVQSGLARIPIDQLYQDMVTFPKPWCTFTFPCLHYPRPFVWHVLPPYLDSKLLLILQSPDHISPELCRLSHLTKIELIAPPYDFHQQLKPWQVQSRISIGNCWSHLLPALWSWYNLSQRQIHWWATQALLSGWQKWRSFGEEIGREQNWGG